jgi:RNA polymerase sigma factor (sigma-70 family)
MVLRVCRRVLGDAHAAEDAAQATWLVLARQAATQRRPQALAAWLHGTARQLALHARRGDQRRRQAEARTAQGTLAIPQPDPLDILTVREFLQMLDEELQRLPERYRLPVILCALEGHTTKEAARQLGWTPGSVRGRLLRGRARLQARLVRRGLSLPAALAAINLGQGSASAGLSAAQVTATVGARWPSLRGAGRELPRSRTRSCFWPRQEGRGWPWRR